MKFFPILLLFVFQVPAYALFSVDDPDEPLGKSASCEDEETLREEADGTITRVVIGKTRIAANQLYVNMCFVTSVSQFRIEQKCDETLFWFLEKKTSISILDVWGYGHGESWVYPKPSVTQHMWQEFDYYKKCSMPCDDCGVVTDKGPIEKELLKHQIVDNFIIPEEYIFNKTKGCSASVYDARDGKLGLCARNTTREMTWLENCGPSCAITSFSPRYHIRSWSWPIDGSPPPPATEFDAPPSCPKISSSSSSSCSSQNSVSSNSSNSNSSNSNSDSSNSSSDSSNSSSDSSNSNSDSSNSNSDSSNSNSDSSNSNSDSSNSNSSDSSSST
jgi:hypothetical protein